MCWETDGITFERRRVIIWWGLFIVLGIIAFPFMVLSELMKMQK